VLRYPSGQPGGASWGATPGSGIGNPNWRLGRGQTRSIAAYSSTAQVLHITDVTNVDPKVLADRILADISKRTREKEDENTRSVRQKKVGVGLSARVAPRRSDASLAGSLTLCVLCVCCRATRTRTRTSRRWVGAGRMLLLAALAIISNVLLLPAAAGRLGRLGRLGGLGGLGGGLGGRRAQGGAQHHHRVRRRQQHGPRGRIRSAALCARTSCLIRVLLLPQVSKPAEAMIMAVHAVRRLCWAALCWAVLGTADCC